LAALSEIAARRRAPRRDEVRAPIDLRAFE